MIIYDNHISKLILNKYPVWSNRFRRKDHMMNIVNLTQRSSD